MSRRLSTITLFQDVPFDETYKHVVNWKNQGELDNYLNQRHHVSMTGSYQNINKPIRWDTKTETFNDLVNYNYCKIEDVDHDGNTKTYYAYLVNFEYMNDGTTSIYFSIDMWNTYMWNVDLSEAYIEKGFVNEMNADGTDWSDEFDAIKNNGEQVGGDGAEKLLYSNPVYFSKVENNGGYVDDAQIQFIVFTTQPKDAKTEDGTLAGVFSQYLYYVLPYNTTNDKTVNVSIKGKQIITGGQNIKDVYKKLATVPEFAGSSSLIVDSEIYSTIGIPYEVKKDLTGINFTEQFDATAKEGVMMQVTSATRGVFKPESGICYIKNPHGNVLQTLIARYAEIYGNDFPKKIMLSPYSKIFFTDGRGTNMQADLGQVTKRNDSNFTISRFGGLTQNGKTSYAFNHYNRRTTDDSGAIQTYENKMMIDDSAKDVPIVLDNYTMYLNANKNQLANVRANAKMNEKLTKEGNAISLSNTERSMATARDVQGYQQQRGMGMAKMDAGLGVISGVASGLASGGLIGGVLGGVGGAIKGGIGLYKQSYSNETAQNTLAMQQATQDKNARVNYAFQNKVATNNYEQTIRSQNAMLADTRNHNDVIAHQGTNYMYDFQNKAVQVHWQIYTSQDTVMENVILYFKLFGYTVNKYDNIAKYINRMTHFSYVKTNTANVHGLAPQPALRTIDDMLDNGVTIWRSDSDSLNKFENKDYSDNHYDY